jgi:preprotein translocase subunit YajC
MFITPAHAQAAAGGGSIFEMLFPLVMVFAIIYFLILRPQQKRQREHQAMIDAIRRGDRVVTQGGLIGKVAKINEDELEIDIADNTRVSVVRSMVISVRSKGEPAQKD